MKNYNRVMLGQRSKFAEECIEEGYIGADYSIDADLTNELTEDYRDFNAKWRPIWLEKNPGKTKVSAGLSCGLLWMLSKGLSIGDVVLSPDGKGGYAVGEIQSDYYFVPGTSLPHRRRVKWEARRVKRDEMSQELRNSTGSSLTLCDITKYAQEIEGLRGDSEPFNIKAADPNVEDPAVFVLEKHLEEFLVKNWDKTILSKDYSIYQEDGELLGQQYPSDTGPIDILAISKDGKTLLVIELKRGRASDAVVGQIQRYMGYIQSELAEPDQQVRGIIIALEDDIRIQRALSVAPNIQFFKYEVNFRLYQ